MDLIRSLVPRFNGQLQNPCRNESSHWLVSILAKALGVLAGLYVGKCLFFDELGTDANSPTQLAGVLPDFN